MVTQNIISNQNLNWHFPEWQIGAEWKEWVSLGIAFSGSFLIKGWNWSILRNGAYLKIIILPRLANSQEIFVWWQGKTEK